MMRIPLVLLLGAFLISLRSVAADYIYRYKYHGALGCSRSGVKPLISAELLECMRVDESYSSKYFCINNSTSFLERIWYSAGCGADGSAPAETRVVSNMVPSSGGCEDFPYDPLDPGVPSFSYAAVCRAGTYPLRGGRLLIKTFESLDAPSFCNHTDGNSFTIDEYDYASDTQSGSCYKTMAGGSIKAFVRTSLESISDGAWEVVSWAGPGCTGRLSQESSSYINTGSSAAGADSRVNRCSRSSYDSSYFGIVTTAAGNPLYRNALTPQHFVQQQASANVAQPTPPSSLTAAWRN